MARDVARYGTAYPDGASVESTQAADDAAAAANTAAARADSAATAAEAVVPLAQDAVERAESLESSMSRAIGKTKHYPFRADGYERGDAAFQPQLDRAIIDVRLQGADPNLHYFLHTARRNDGGIWRLTIASSETIGGTATHVCEYHTTTSPEGETPGRHVAVLEGTSVTAAIEVVWSELEEGVPLTNFRYYLSPDTLSLDAAPDSALAARDTRQRVVAAEADAAMASRAARRGGAIALTHPLAESADLGPSASHGGLSRDEMLREIERAVVDVRIIGGDSAETYMLERIRRNANGGWLIQIRRGSDGVIVMQYISATSPEPEDSTEVHKALLNDQGGSGMVGYIWVRWSYLTPGVNHSNLDIPLAHSVQAPAVPRHGLLSPGDLAQRAEVPRPAVIIPDTATGFSWDGSTLSWGQFVLVTDVPALSLPRIRVAAGSVDLGQEIQQVAYIDLSSITDAASTQPASIVRVQRYNRDPHRFTSSPHQVALFVYANEHHQYPVVTLPGITTDGPGPPPSLRFDAHEVVVRVDASEESLTIYTPASAGTPRYISWPVRRHVSEDDPRDRTGGNADIWTIRGGGGVVTRSGEQSFSGVVDEMWGEGEWECAINYPARVDWMGGRTHGSERMTQPALLFVDGVEVDLGATAWHRGSSIMLITVSELLDVPYVEWTDARPFQEGEVRWHGDQHWISVVDDNVSEPGTGPEWETYAWQSLPQAEHRKRYEWTRDGLRLTQDVVWQVSPDRIGVAYLAMMPVNRSAITSALEHVAYSHIDLSEAGDEVDITPVATRVTMHGDSYSADVEVSASPAMTNRLFFTRLAARNKIYWQVDTSEEPGVGDHWRVTSLYQVRHHS